ncbi:phage virion morphogenesis protein, partial [Salmonella enterica subsp. enterica serovar Waycross]|nr:phage virion morphogenesis protein [Salmonella enterica subsp. enterica serovar Ealing]ECS8252927.1 phage virion morphogenesis protein [Salmonella enterica subsp. enterica serovar Waycross]EDJ9408463.1 phage virion morphogenesis protein [Salmonella enterica]
MSILTNELDTIFSDILSGLSSAGIA